MFTELTAVLGVHACSRPGDQSLRTTAVQDGWLNWVRQRTGQYSAVSCNAMHAAMKCTEQFPTGSCLRPRGDPMSVQQQPNRLQKHVQATHQLPSFPALHEYALHCTPPQQSECQEHIRVRTDPKHCIRGPSMQPPPPGHRAAHTTSRWWWSFGRSPARPHSPEPHRPASP